MLYGNQRHNIQLGQQPRGAHPERHRSGDRCPQRWAYGYANHGGRRRFFNKAKTNTIQELMADTTPELFRNAMSPEDWEFWQTNVGREIITE